MTTTAAGLQTFTIDKAHSESSFQVRHLISKVRGRFTDFSGSIQFDESAPERSTVAFTVQTASVDTSQPDRDGHLRSADFFSVAEYPTMTFKSSGVRVLGPSEFEVAGRLTIRGTSQDVRFPVTYLGGASDPWGHQRIGFEAKFTINRHDFGLNWNAALETGGFLVGDNVTIELSIQAIAS
jgi:polyisoprenoid-binding protein YceI